MTLAEHNRLLRELPGVVCVPGYDLYLVPGMLMPRWRRLYAEEPAPDTLVLVYVKSELKCGVWSAMWTARAWRCQDGVSLFSRCPGDVTHWMPLPDAPDAG